MKVVIMGCGRVGSTLARDLDTAGHEVTIIDERVAAFNRLGEGFNGNMVVGTGIDESVLRRAGIDKADCFASVTNGDNRNIMAAQVAKVVFNVPRVITRIYDPIREQTYREFGMETICSTTIVSSMISTYFTGGANPAHTEPPPIPVAAHR
ncbi:MAG: TrkA family potassium uptake protein [Candidatus Dormibacteraeota bacterium]|uniref:TrkA family potassium uptake protein n=1 Tax=Candidatus Amunia macphersoniae TaxID=3127014 RepID=A0A934KLE4_9BACT|nr:TrkA family potassium uptake protein [Candidatus Dormibacteraeota bacterium]